MTKFTTLKLLILLFFICSCEKDNSIEFDSKTLLIGSWIEPAYILDTVTFKRANTLQQNAPGISFKKNTAFVERSSGFCGTPPITYFDIEGTWNKHENIVDIFYTSTTLNIPKPAYSYKIISLTEDMLTVKRVYNPQPVNHSLIGKGNLYGNGNENIEKSNLVVTNTIEWNNLITKMNSVNNVSNTLNETSIDFSKYQVIAIFNEVKPNGGHFINISISENSQQRKVQVVYSAPQGNATTVITQPFYIAKILKNDLPIVFL